MARTEEPAGSFCATSGLFGEVGAEGYFKMSNVLVSLKSFPSMR
jgi:hypothetical protein